MSVTAKAFIALMLLIAWFSFMTIVFSSMTDTGPGCPSDPEWLGYCSEVDVR